MKITRIPGDEDAYQVPARLVNWLVYSIFAALLTIGGYMVVWNRSYVVGQVALLQRIDSLTATVSEVKTILSVGILPRTEERINALTERIKAVEREHEYRFYSAPQKAPPP